MDVIVLVPLLRICLNVTAAITLESDSPDVDEESEFETYSGSHEDDRFQTHHVSDEETLILRFPSSFFNSLNGYCINEEEEITTQRFIFFFKERSYSITIHARTSVTKVCWLKSLQK